MRKLFLIISFLVLFSSSAFAEETIVVDGEKFIEISERQFMEMEDDFLLDNDYFVTRYNEVTDELEYFIKEEIFKKYLKET